MKNYIVSDTDMISVADAIREKGGTSDALTFPGGFVDAVGAIQAGGESVDTLEQHLMGTITSFESDKVITIKGGLNKSSIKYLSFPNATTANATFSNADLSQGVNLPKLGDTLQSNMFSGTTLKTIALPKIAYVNNNAFYACSSLTTVDLGNSDMTTGRIASAVFMDNSAMTVLILRQNAVINLSSVNSFNNTPFARGGTGGTIYVPSSLIESYKIATNWCTLYEAGSLNFAAIEGSEYE